MRTRSIPCGVVLLAGPKRLDDVDVLSSQVADLLEVLLPDRFGIDQLAADAEAACAGLQERRRRFEIDAAGRHDANLRQRPPNRLEKRRSHDLGGKDFDDV